MIKISALNDESEEESGTEEEVTKEALEQIALQQYSKALDLQRKGNLKDATQLLKDLLDTELLYEVKKPPPGEKIVGPLLNLKYLCYKNLAAMLASADEVDAAIDAYCTASELDETDITLWHRLGQLCMQAKRYELALHAFQMGVDRNPKHWPCLDKMVTLLLGLDYKESCISVIYDTLKLDPGYLRGLAYRKHIYTVYPHIRDFMKYLNPNFAWNESEDEPFDELMAEKLIKEAMDINETFIEQQKAEEFKCKLPDLKLKKPISEFSWQSVGESLVHMHHFMTENFFSHACYLELVFEKIEKEEPMEVCEEEKPDEAPVENTEVKELETDKAEKNENESENENNNSDKDKAATDTEKVESDVEIAIEKETEPDGRANEEQPEPKRKVAVRRRGSDLSFLQQWEWCKKRRSGRKKTNRQDVNDNIYDTLRKMVPPCLSPEIIQKKENQARETTPDLEQLFDEKSELSKKEKEEYFGTPNEQRHVKEFINKYKENKRDIIDMLKEYLSILAGKWKTKWPENLADIFIEANNCYNNHVDLPTCTDENRDELIHHAIVNILVEEFSIDKKLNSEEKQSHNQSVVDIIGLTLYLNPQILSGVECLEMVLRQLWAKMHIHLLNKNEDLALDVLYQLLCEFEAMGEHHSTYNLELVNFKSKPILNEAEILAYIKFLERNRKLATVMDLYERGNYEEVLSIVIDSFEHCKTLARNQEDEMSLDFAVQLSIILDTYWALDDVDNCFKWSLICLHEALKHYFRYTSGSPEYEKWTLTVVKILYCMEHILTTEGLACLDSVSAKELSQGLEDLIRIIGHQVETNATEMPFGTVTPWIIMHFILQREEDQGRLRLEKDKDCDDVPNPLLILFIAHEQLGNREWCCKSDGKLLYFTLDTVVPRLRSPALSKCLEQVCQSMEQCVYCLFGHPGKKNKVKYLVEHAATPHELNWERAQQVYEIFRPPELPVLEGKISGISVETELLFHRILSQMPPEYDVSKYVTAVKNYIKGTEDKLPAGQQLLPFKMRDIYFLLGDYYFKKEDRKMAVKYNILDVVVNNNRLESWAQISLAKALNLEMILHSCKNLSNEREFLNPAKSIIRCFQRTLQIDPTHCNMWIEYGMFVYTVHSFCSRLLKQASESLSMEDFESLEKQKDDLLDTTQKCFTTTLNDLNNVIDGVKDNEDSWLHYYMLGKVAEKRNKPPSVYLDYYMKGVKSLLEANATYPLKINYNSPPNLCIEVLELHYRIHASILKYIEQHENKPIPNSVGKVFTNCIEEWKNGPFIKKPKKDTVTETESEPNTEEPFQAANILKRSVSDAGEEETQEAKRLKLESAAAKVRRSASYDTERLVLKDSTVQPAEIKVISKITASAEEKKQEPLAKPETPTERDTVAIVTENKSTPVNITQDKMETDEKAVQEKDVASKENEKKEESSSSSSSSSSESSSSDSSSDSTSDSSRDSEASANSNDAKNLTEEEILKIVGPCLDALEDCASRFPAHYKAIYRVAHYHFYYKKGKDIERCRDLMLSTFSARSGQKLAGLFSERKNSNFFNNIWKIPLQEVDRAGGFSFHMSRSVLLTMEILKEIDDHRTLLDLSLQLQKIPDLDKKYLRDSDREELSQQAFSLCIQSLKGQLTRFSQQADLKSNDVEQAALRSLMLDIYKAYQRAQKQLNTKQFTNLLVEGYKLVTTEPITENMNLVDLSMKFCQKSIQQLKYEATLASIDKSQNAQKKQAAKHHEPPKPVAPVIQPPKSDAKATAPVVPAPTSTSAAGLPKMSAHEIAAAFQTYLPMLNDPVTTQQTAATFLSYLSNMSALSYPSLPRNMQTNIQSTLQNSLQNSFQAEFYRQFLGQSLSSYLPPPAKKQKRGPKTNVGRPPAALKTSKSFTAVTTKAAPTSVITSVQKPSASVQKASVSMQKSLSTPLTPSMGTVLSSLPASLTANLTSYGSHSSSTHSSAPTQAHMSTASTVNAAIHTKPPLPHQQVSPGKTLQEKLAERQKHHPITKDHKSKVLDVNASISKLPSSLTITKTSSKQPVPKKPEAKKSLPFSQPKPIAPDEVIILDDD